MNADVFVDTNVLVYARDASQLVKQPLAKRWMRHLWMSQRGRLSMQVLHEYYYTVTRKLRPGLPREAARRDVSDLASWDPMQPSLTMLRGACMLQDRFDLAFWDSLTVPAAQLAGCRYVLTEDMEDGQVIDAITVLRPFTISPESLSMD